MDAQLALLQSLLATHILPLGQVMGAQVAPQSTSDSLPFLMPSVQVGVVQRCVVALQYSGLEQSLLARHIPPEAHRGHMLAPPQSLSVSTPFLIMSEHDGAAQTEATHDPLAQSAPVPHG
jgi:hypothetical protein